jgi:hypothetical protein
MRSQGLAGAEMPGQASGQTPQTTAPVHEAWLRLVGEPTWLIPQFNWPVLTTGTFGGGGAYSTNTFTDTGILTNSPRRFYTIESP